MINFFHDTLYQPLYNGLVFLIDIVPGSDVGFAVLVLTVLVKLVLLPLSEKAVATQLSIKKYDKELNDIKIKYSKDKEAQARAVLDFYRSHGINPIASFLVILIQIPIIISLYYVFYKAGLPDINKELLYSFVKEPEIVSMHFLGFLDISGKSALFAVLVGVTQFLQMKLSMPNMPEKKKTDGAPSLKDELARSMHIQMRYVMPILVAFISYTISAAVSIYWTTSNIFAIAQELYLRKKFFNLREEVVKIENNIKKGV